MSQEARERRSRPAIGCHLLKRKAENERDNQVQ
jgi:hypothetical protein